MKHLFMLFVALSMLTGCIKSSIEENNTDDLNKDNQEELIEDNQFDNEFKEPVINKDNINDDSDAIDQNNSNEEIPPNIELNKILVKSIKLDNGSVIEHYITTYPRNSEQLLKEDYIHGNYLPFEKFGTEQIIFIDFNDSIFSNLNQEITEEYEKNIKTIKYFESKESSDYVSECDILLYDIYQNDDIISIVETKRHILWDAGSLPYEFRIFNIDKKNGELLSNDRLIQNYESLTEEVIKTLDEEGYTKREEGLELDHEKLYYGYNDSDLSLSLPINDQSLIYKKDDKWNIILKISQVGSNFGDRVKIEISSETNQ